MTHERKNCDCGCMGLGPAFRQMTSHIGPPKEAREHFRAARVEILKGMRAVIDARIAWLSKPEETGRSVPVE